MSRPGSPLVLALAAATALLVAAARPAAAQAGPPRVLTFLEAVKGSEERRPALAGGGGGGLRRGDRGRRRATGPRLLRFRRVGVSWQLDAIRGDARDPGGPGLGRRPLRRLPAPGQGPRGLRGPGSRPARRCPCRAGSSRVRWPPIRAVTCSCTTTPRGRALRLSGDGTQTAEVEIAGRGHRARAPAPPGASSPRWRPGRSVLHFSANGSLEDTWTLPAYERRPGLAGGAGRRARGHLLVVDRHAGRLLVLDGGGQVAGLGLPARMGAGAPASSRPGSPGCRAASSWWPTRATAGPRSSGAPTEAPNSELLRGGPRAPDPRGPRPRRRPGPPGRGPGAGLRAAARSPGRRRPHRLPPGRDRRPATPARSSSATRGGDRILIFDTDGIFLHEIPGGDVFSAPRDLAVDPEGFLVVVANHERRPALIELDFDGLFLREIRLSGLPEEAIEPVIISVALSPAGDRLYALDSANLHLWIGTRDGEIESSVDLAAGAQREGSGATSSSGTSTSTATPFSWRCPRPPRSGPSAPTGRPRRQRGQAGHRSLHPGLPHRRRPRRATATS